MNRLESKSPNVDFGPKREKFGPKGPKMGGARLLPNPKLNFLKETHKISFYTKNQQNSKNRLEYIS